MSLSNIRTSAITIIGLLAVIAGTFALVFTASAESLTRNTTMNERSLGNDSTSVLIGFSDVTAEAGTSVSLNIELDNSSPIAGAQLNFTIDPQIDVTGSSYFGRGEGFTGGASNSAWLMFDMSGLQIAAYSGVPSDLAVATLNLDLACELPAGNYFLTPTQSIISDALGNAVPSASYGGTLTVTPSTTDCDTESNDDSAGENDETQVTPGRPKPVMPSRKGDSPSRITVAEDKVPTYLVGEGVDAAVGNDSAPVLIGFSDATAEAGTSVSLNIELDNSFSIAGAQLNFVFDSQIHVTGSSYFGRAAGVTETFNDLGFSMGGASNTAWLMFDITGLQIAAYSGVPSDLAVATLNIDLACELPAGNYFLTPTQSIISDALGNAVPSVSYSGTLTVTPSTTDCDTESNALVLVRPAGAESFDDDLHDDGADENDETQITPRHPNPVMPSRKGDSPSRITVAEDEAAVGGLARSAGRTRLDRTRLAERKGDSPSRITVAEDEVPTYHSADGKERAVEPLRVSNFQQNDDPAQRIGGLDQHHERLEIAVGRDASPCETVGDSRPVTLLPRA